MADTNAPTPIATDHEAREFVKRGGHPNDTTPRRQAEIASAAQQNEARKDQAANDTPPNPHHARFQPPLGHSTNPIRGPLPHDHAGPRVNYTIPAERALREPQLGTQAAPIVGPPIGSSPGVFNPGNNAGLKGPEHMVHVTEEAEAEHRARTNERAGNVPPDPVIRPGKFVSPDGSTTSLTPSAGQSDIDAARAMAAAGEEESKAAEAKPPTSGGTDHGAPASSGGNSLREDTPSAGSTAATGSTGSTSSTGPTGSTAQPSADNGTNPAGSH